MGETLGDTDRSVGRRKQEVSKRQEKAERILDAAAGLILRRGYDSTTMDDIAKRAGIAKGTLYLYWKTREDLFRTLMRRERLKWTEDYIQRIDGDPMSVTLRGMFRHSALALMKRPLLKAVILRDMDVIGKLAYSDQSSTASLERLAGFETYLGVLREHNLVRTDLSLQAQVYTVSAIFMGFFLVAPLVPGKMTFSDEELADLIAEAIHRTLEPEHSVSSDDLQPLVSTFSQYMNRELEITKERFWQELE